MPWRLAFAQLASQLECSFDEAPDIVTFSETRLVTFDKGDVEVRVLLEALAKEMPLTVVLADDVQGRAGFGHGADFRS